MSEIMKDLTEEETLALGENQCPDCGGGRFLKGPEKGLAREIMCANPECQAAFNIFVDTRVRGQRLSFGKSKKGRNENVG